MKIRYIVSGTEGKRASLEKSPFSQKGVRRVRRKRISADGSILPLGVCCSSPLRHDAAMACVTSSKHDRGFCVAGMNHLRSKLSSRSR